MKMDVNFSVQQTQTELNEKFFSIADPAFVFDLLRNKIYSNPILAVCRELTCNALDAHREVGKGDQPIVVHLPTHYEPYFKVRDFGPGISPSRMDDIYLKYAASTKRDSNDQIGAFGIGAKSPFSYSDSFTIVTNFDGKCYNYMAFIDESRMGKLITLSETDTEESNGTEIIVPVKPADIANFHSNFELTTRHWKVKPKLNQDSPLVWREINPIIGNDDWFISNTRDSYYEKKIKVLVGDIEYNLDNLAAKSFADISILSATSADIYLKFNVGDVSLAANRESLYLDPQTKSKIHDRMLKIKQEYVSMVKDKINSFPSFWEASVFVANDLSNICQDILILGDVYWNGLPVVNKIYDDGLFTITEFYLKNNWNNQKVHHRKTGSVRFQAGSAIIIHDCGKVEPNSRHLKPFFTENPSIKSFFVIQPKDPESEDFDLDNFINGNNFNHYGYSLLSKHNKTIKSRKVNDKAKLIVYKYDTSSAAFVTCNIEAFKSDLGKKVFCHLKKDIWRNRKTPVYSNQEIIAHNVLYSASKIDSNVNIYGVDDAVDPARVSQFFKGCTPIEEHIASFTELKDQEYYFETIWAFNQHSNCIHKYSDPRFVQEIACSNSPMLELIKFQNSLQEIVSLRKQYIETLRGFGMEFVRKAEDQAKYEIWAQQKNDINNLINKVNDAYPLIKLLDSWRFQENMAHIINYINLVDKSNNQG